VREAVIGDASAIEIDLSDHTFIDSSGLKGLLAVHETAGAQFAPMVPGWDRFRVLAFEALLALVGLTMARWRPAAPD
jgi:hypothetical protein